MSQKLTARAFFFNRKTDYLPYYKNFSLTLEDDAIAKDILIAIQAQNDMFAFPELNLIFKINDLIVEEDTPLISIIEKLGRDLRIDPVSIFRANNGLIINNDDFMKSYEILAPYATASDKKYYKTLYALHYASETENFDHEYIGDAILVLAHKMISEGNEHKTDILSAITSPSSGLLDCEYENNLFYTQRHTATITALKEMVKNDSNEHPSLLDMISKRFGSKKEKTIIKKDAKKEAKPIEDIENKHIAYYAGSKTNENTTALFQTFEISTVKFSRVHKLSGLTLMDDNKKLALTKAGTTLLDAFDSGAEVLVIEDNATFDMMHDNFKAIENVLGRKMIGLELINAEDFALQLNELEASVEQEG